MFDKLWNNRGFILTAILALAIETEVSIDCVAQTQPSDASSPHLSESELISATRQKLAQDTASDSFAGAVLIAHKGKPVFAQAYGLADREHKIPNTLETRFRIGSMNKMFTGMTSTGSDPKEPAVAGLSIGYTATGAANDLRPNTGMLPYRGTSAGGGYSTVGDLLRFTNAIQQDRLLNAHYTELLTVGRAATEDGLVASAFGDYSINGIRCFGDAGGSFGMNSDLEVCPAPGYVVIVLANMDPPAAELTSLFISNRLPER
jgi:CubicO group peptidase (beta-lactamase class C family)